jgi:hypothetical protein
MTKLEAVKIFEENGIEWTIDKGRRLLALCKMTTRSGDDCSEWIEKSEMLELIQNNIVRCPV